MVSTFAEETHNEETRIMCPTFEETSSKVKKTMATMITTLKLALRPSLYIRSRLFSTNTGFCRTSDIMGRKRVRVACLSFFRAPAACFRIWSPPVRSKPTANSINAAQKTEFLGNGREDDFSTDTDHSAKAGEVIGNKIMIVVDSSLEAKGALEWALSHTVQSQDTVILVHVSNLSKQGETTNFVAFVICRIHLRQRSLRCSQAYCCRV